MITALVPIKKNSQRIPNKNFLEINSKPLFYWIINNLLNSKFVDDIVINHDDDYTVQEVSKYFESIKFYKRPDELFGDDVSMNKIIESSLDECIHETIIQVHTTSPLLKTNTIDEAIEFHLNKKQDIFSVSKLQERLFDKNLKPLNHDINNLVQTQDLEPLYVENSALYIFTKKNFKRNNNRINKNSDIFEISFPENIDIDNFEDFELARIFLEKNL
tara:strand:- start:6092 stop:6742 length:651 start_codon:yes stop_codon:yes gene_type:complete